MVDKEYIIIYNESVGLLFETNEVQKNLCIFGVNYFCLRLLVEVDRRMGK
jgi:hypothetical protein